MRKSAKKRRTETLTLTAPVAPETPPIIVDLPTLQWNLGGPSSQTIRNHIAKGMPRLGSKSRPRFNLTDCLIWDFYYRHLKHSHANRYRDHVDLAAARAWWLEIQHKDFPGTFVLVPLEHDHPWRRRQLAIAAAGVVPPPLDPADDWDDEDEAA